MSEKNVLKIVDENVKLVRKSLALSYGIIYNLLKMIENQAKILKFLGIRDEKLEEAIEYLRRLNEKVKDMAKELVKDEYK